MAVRRLLQGGIILPVRSRRLTRLQMPLALGMFACRGRMERFRSLPMPAPLNSSLLMESWRSITWAWEYSPKDVLLGLIQASNNKIGSPVANILTYCYHYDPETNRQSLRVARVVQLAVW